MILLFFIPLHMYNATFKHNSNSTIYIIHINFKHNLLYQEYALHLYYSLEQANIIQYNEPIIK